MKRRWAGRQPAGWLDLVLWQRNHSKHFNESVCTYLTRSWLGNSSFQAKCHSKAKIRQKLGKFHLACHVIQLVLFVVWSVLAFSFHNWNDLTKCCIQAICQIKRFQRPWTMRTAVHILMLSITWIKPDLPRQCRHDSTRAHMPLSPSALPAS